MKKGLVISWYFPPINSSEGLVTFKLLKNSKYEYDVFTQNSNTNWSYGANADKLTSSNINTIFAKTKDINEWVKEGIEYYEANKDKYSFIMSRSMAPESHMIALEIKHRHPDIKWIASFGDPIADNPFNYFFKQTNPYTIKGMGIENISIKHAINPLRITKSCVWKMRNKRYKRKHDPETKNIILQREVLQNADRIILNNEYQKKHMLKTCVNKDEIEKKIIVIPHTYDSDFYDKRVKKNKNKIKFVYLGHLDDIRTPKNFLEALNRLNKSTDLENKLSVEFYGDLSALDKARIIDYDLCDVVKVKKPVSYFESLKIMQESNWLLLVDANLNQFLPENIFFAAKIADYLGANSNIFGITMIDGASADILRETNSVVSSYSVDEIYMYLRQIVDGTCEFETTNNSKYDIKNVIINYDEMIKDLIK